MADHDLGIAGLSDAEPIGRGGFAVVYRARQDRFSRTVAVKVLQGHDLDATARARFERECSALGSLSTHPNIVTVYDGGFTSDDRPYLVMEYFPDGSLGDRLDAGGTLPPSEVANVGAALAGAVDAAHQQGIIHRDIKPANVLVGTHGQVCLADFGIARVAGTAETKSGVVTASVLHAAPEVIGGERPTEQSDVYSLGSTLFELLAGSPAFVRETDESIVPVLARIIGEPVPNLRRSGVPDALASAIERSMAKDPAERFATARDLATALGKSELDAGATLSSPDLLPAPGAPAANTTDAHRRRRWPVVLVIAAAAVALAAGVFAVSRGSGSSGTAATSTSTTEEASDTSSSTPTTAEDAAATSTTAPLTPPSELLGLTDPDPTNWIPSDAEATQTFQLRVFDSTTWAIIDAFPVTMNGCDTRQISVRWRSLSGSVRPGITSYWDPTLGDVQVDQPGEPATEGTMLLNGCEQPAFQLLPSPGTIENLTVEASVNQPGFG